MPPLKWRLKYMSHIDLISLVWVLVLMGHLLMEMESDREVGACRLYNVVGDLAPWLLLQHPSQPTVAHLLPFAKCQVQSALTNTVPRYLVVVAGTLVAAAPAAAVVDAAGVLIAASVAETSLALVIVVGAAPGVDVDAAAGAAVVASAVVVATAG